MTEQEWLEFVNPQSDLPNDSIGRLIRFLETQGSPRKLRLYVLACCQRLSYILAAMEWSSVALAITEDVAEGRCSVSELESHREHAGQVGATLDAECRFNGAWVPGTESTAAQVCAAYAFGCAMGANLATQCHTTESGGTYYTQAADATGWHADEAIWLDELARTRDRQAANGARRREIHAQALTLHDIFGNPFHPVTVNPAWLTSTVVSLATAIYADRAFDRLPILADALEDAGCTNADMLNHCRQPGEHVRGCWPVDLLLGKS
jgi:hypothetical protein